MITLTRSLARHLRAVFRSAEFRQTFTNSDARVLFTAGPTGLIVEGMSDNVGLQYRLPGEFPTQRFAVSFECLAACEGKSVDPVTLEPLDEHRVVARWTARKVPQAVEFHTGSIDTFTECPAAPEVYTTNAPGLLTALRDAAASTDDTSTRFALGCIQLWGKTGQLVATDGRELLAQSGFDFPWTDAALIPSSDIFNCRELPQDALVEVARTETHVVMRIGAWTIFLAINKEGRFPATEMIQPATAASSSLQLAESDRAFLRDSLPHLPTSLSQGLPVTLDLNGQVIVRSKGEGQAQPTELVLTNSRLDGDPLKAAMNRKYLERAVKLGFEQVHFFGAEAAVQCDDGRRQYIWMPLHANFSVPGSAAATRIESPSAEPVGKPRRVPRPAAREPISIAAEPASPACAETAQSTPTPASSPIEAAVAMQGVLRDALAQIKVLVTTLRRERKRTRLVRSTLSSLRQLETVAG